jgi:hypothetical protein
MKEEQATWEEQADSFIKRVARAMAGVRHPRKQEVLSDLRAHLDQRYAELAAEQRTPAALAAIIEEMGPPGEFAELLEPGDGARAGLWPLLRRRPVRVGVVLGGLCVLVAVLSIALADKTAWSVRWWVLIGRN